MPVVRAGRNAFLDIVARLGPSEPNYRFLRNTCCAVAPSRHWERRSV